MFERDANTLFLLLDDVAEMRQLPALSPRAKALFFRALERYSIEQIQSAIEAHLTDPEAGKFKTHIQPAHIVAQIEGAASNDGRPEPDEAWGIALRAQDEAVTVVWTDDICAAFNAARPVMAAGDETGARMAFKAAYTRIVTKARAGNVAPRWLASLGHDAAQRTDALQIAVDQGKLAAPHVAGLLPAPTVEPEEVDTEAARANIRRLHQMLATAMSPSEKRRRANEQASKAERDRLDALKRESAEKVRQYQEQQA